MIIRWDRHMGSRLQVFLMKKQNLFLFLWTAKTEILKKSQIYSQISTAVMEEDHGQKIDVKAESMTSDNKFDIERSDTVDFSGAGGTAPDSCMYG